MKNVNFNLLNVLTMNLDVK